MTQIVLAFKVVTLVFAALASIMNPPANVPIFLASTAGSSPDVRTRRPALVTTVG